MGVDPAVIGESHFTFDVGMSGIGSPGWVVGCRVSEQERVGGVSRTCEPISLSCVRVKS